MVRLYPKVPPDPKPQNIVVLDQSNLDAALATQIFLLESHLQHEDKILPLLLNLLKCLPYTKLNEQRELNWKTKGCLAEEISFQFVLLLLEIAALQKEKNRPSNVLVSSIFDVFQVLVQECISVEKQPSIKKG